MSRWLESLNTSVANSWLSTERLYNDDPGIFSGNRTPFNKKRRGFPYCLPANKETRIMRLLTKKRKRRLQDKRKGVKRVKAAIVSDRAVTLPQGCQKSA